MPVSLDGRPQVDSSACIAPKCVPRILLTVAQLRLIATYPYSAETGGSSTLDYLLRAQGRLILLPDTALASTDSSIVL